MLKKLSTYNYVFWKSISSFKYYQDVVKTKFSFSFKYFWTFSLFLGLIISIPLNFTVIPAVNQFVNRAQTRLPNLYPQDLVITIKDGQVSTNVAEPLRFPIPYELFTDTPPAISDQKQQYLITIDTNAQVENYKSSQSLIFITRDNLVITEDLDGSYRLFPISDIDDITIDKPQIDSLVNLLLPWFKYLPWLLGIIIFLVFIIFLPLLRLISLVFLSLILLVGANLLKLNLNYKKIYQIGLHSLTLPTLIQVGIAAFGLVIPIPFFTSIVFLLYTLVILADMWKK